MYIPPQFKGKEEDALQFIRDYPFGVLTSYSSRPLATHLPFVLEKTGEEWLLQSHMAIANPQWKTLHNQKVLVIFSEPHAYISPRHYTSKQNVPTWNYVAAHVYGNASVLTNKTENEQVIEDMIHFFEKQFQLQWESLSERYQNALLAEIVGITVQVSEIQFQEKISQNKSGTERERMIHELSNKEKGAEVSLANYMRSKEQN